MTYAYLYVILSEAKDLRPFVFLPANGLFPQKKAHGYFHFTNGVVY